jgi:hypothetical protein
LATIEELLPLLLLLRLLLLLLLLLLLMGEEGTDDKLSSCRFLPFHARRRRRR